MTHLKRYQRCIINLKLSLLNKRKHKTIEREKIKVLVLTKYMSSRYPRSRHCYVPPKTAKAEQSSPN